jgi:hypothetical protein
VLDVAGVVAVLRETGFDEFGRRPQPRADARWHNLPCGVSSRANQQGVKVEDAYTFASGRELPMACSLQGAEVAKRGELIRRIAEAGVERADRGEEGVEFRFRPVPGLRDSLQELIELEGECCPFLEFQLRERPDALTLTVRGPDGASSALDAIHAVL